MSKFATKITHFRHKLYAFIKEILDKTPGLEGFILMRNDGFIIAHMLPENVDEYLFSAIAVSILSISQKAFSNLQYGDLNYIILHGKEKQLLLSFADRDFIICFLASKETKIDLILKKVEEITRKIQELRPIAY